MNKKKKPNIDIGSVFNYCSAVLRCKSIKMDLNKAERERENSLSWLSSQEQKKAIKILATLATPVNPKKEREEDVKEKSLALSKGEKAHMEVFCAILAENRPHDIGTGFIAYSDGTTFYHGVDLEEKKKRYIQHLAPVRPGRRLYYPIPVA